MSEQDGNLEVGEKEPDFSSSRRPLEHREKVVLWVISGLGLGVLFLGYLQLSFQIKAAFTPQNLKASQPSSQQNTGNLTSTFQSELEVGQELRSKDTDNDGLSDYDELKVHKTSPYLDDSDSDSIKDKKEVKDGTDPNCPQGKICRQESEKSSAGTNTNTPTSSDSPPVSFNVESELRQAVPIEQLRQLLIEQGGLTKEQVDQIDDATLRRIYEETLANLNQQVEQ